MSTPPLPDLSPDAAPEFIDADTCKAWLENVPLTNVSAAQADLLSQMEEFNRAELRPAIRLAVLEAIREAVTFVQIEQAKRFTNRAQPMLEAEAGIFEDTLALWTQMQIGYLRCLQDCEDGDATIKGEAALICQRLLTYVGLGMFHHYRAYRQVPGRDWRALHEAYARAEGLGVAETVVKDYLNRDVHDTSPRVAYVRAVLMGICNPNELTQRQLTFAAFLLERWGDKVVVAAEPPEAGEVAPLFVDLSGERMAERRDAAPDPGEHIRFLVTDDLGKSMRNRIGLLRKGESPARLALGEDCVQPSCEQQLTFLYRQWCLLRQPRIGERKSVAGEAQVCTTMAAVHYYISGKVFRVREEQKELTKKQREEIATFGRVSTRDDDDYSQAHGFVLEHWQIEDESIQGLRMMRRAGNPGRRFAHGQLVGIKTADSKNFMLGHVRWLMSTENGDLHAGIKLMPGLPAAIAARFTGLNAINEKFVQSLTLTAVPQLESPPALLIPSGWFKPKRVIEVHLDSAMRVQLTGLLERGGDFERVGYEILPD